MAARTLLEKAKAVKLEQIRVNDITDEKIELAVAWFQDKVNAKQVMVAMGLKAMPYGQLALWLREAGRKGLISAARSR